MPGRDHTGPRGLGPRTGHAHGSRDSVKSGKTEHGSEERTQHPEFERPHGPRGAGHAHAHGFGGGWRHLRNFGRSSHGAGRGGRGGGGSKGG